ncbi:MAG: hypothetical protein QMC67_13280 [Candidatus Wallbacteria bacterium]
MQIINQSSHIEKLCQINPKLEPLIEPIEEYFSVLKDIFYNAHDAEEFLLDKEAGHIVVIEKPSDANNLNAAGIGAVTLKNSNPEAIEKLMLNNGNFAYKISVGINNSYLVTLFSMAGTLDNETEKWLRENCERSINNTGWLN